MSNSEPVLCFVKDHWAYFTYKPLEDQWGDDWDDAPYEHNAGEPCGTDAEIVKVAWEGDFATPCDDCDNSRWSVQQINVGAVAWIFSESWADKVMAIPAGTKLSDFCRLIKEGGGRVYKQC